MPRVPFQPVQEVGTEAIRSPFLQDGRPGAIRRAGAQVAGGVASASEAIVGALEKANAMRRLESTRQAQATASGLMSEFETLRGNEPMEKWDEYQQRFEDHINELEGSFNSERQRKSWQLEVVDPLRVNWTSRAAGHINRESQLYAEELLKSYRTEGARELVSSAASQPVTGDSDADTERVADQFGFEMSVYLEELADKARKITRSDEAAEAMVDEARSDAIVLLVDNLMRQADNTPGRLETAKAIFEESAEFVVPEKREVLKDALQQADIREDGLKRMAKAAERTGFDDPFWPYTNPNALREMQKEVDAETRPEVRAVMAADLNRRDGDLTEARQAQQTQILRTLYEALEVSGGDITAIKRDLAGWRKLEVRDQVWLETRAAQMAAGAREPRTDHVALLRNYYQRRNPDGSWRPATVEERAKDDPARYRAIANDADFKALVNDYQAAADKMAAGAARKNPDRDTMAGTLRQRVIEGLEADGFTMDPALQSWVVRQAIAEQEAAERGGAEITPEKADEIEDRIRAGAVQQIEFYTGPAAGTFGGNVRFPLRDVSAWTDHLREAGVKPPIVPRGTWIPWKQLDPVEQAVGEIYVQAIQQAQGLGELPADSGHLQTAVGGYAAEAAMTEAWRRTGMDVRETAGQQFLEDAALMRARGRAYLEGRGLPVTDENLVQAVRDVVGFDQERSMLVDDDQVVAYLREIGRFYHAMLYESLRFQGIPVEDAARRIGLNPESLPQAAGAR